MKVSSEVLLVEENEVVDEHIVPRNPSDVFRKVIVLPGGHVKGSIVAGSAELHSGSRVEGSVLAGSVTVVVSDSTRERAEVRGDVIGLTRVAVSAPPGVLEEAIEPILVVRGDVIAKHEVNLTTSIVYGNILSERVELANTITLGVLGLIKFEETVEQVTANQPPSKVRNSVVFALLSEHSLEVSGALGIISPLIYIKQDAAISGDGEIVLVDPVMLLKLVTSTLSQPGKLFEPLSSFISRYIAEHGIARIPASTCRGVISMVELERLPAIRDMRRASIDELLFKIAERQYST